MTMTWKPSRLSSHRRTLVLDTSAVLNMLACGTAARLLGALDLTLIVPQQVIVEVKREPVVPDDPSHSMEGLLQRGALQAHHLTGSGYDTFIELAAAEPPDGLGDGEAATIATAEQLACECVIDERKAIRIARGRRADVGVLCSLDLFLIAEERKAFAAEVLADLVFKALFHARMRVPQNHRAWVLSLIGAERAAQCSSLAAALRAR
ncbi:MAG: hypothetical protein P4L92_00135 [Rudaea sp.]|nr:hypothetical protein [Rudaea sp.]